MKRPLWWRAPARAGADRRLAKRLAGAPLPSDDAARERVGRALSAAFESSTPAAIVGRSGVPHGDRRSPIPVRGRARQRLAPAVALALTLALAAAALAATGEGGAVTAWLRHLVDPAPPAHPLGRLPAPGRLLVTSAHGAWLVDADGDRHELGPFSDATWSPHGLFVAGVDGRRLTVVDPAGDERWELAARGHVDDVRWSPDGYRIAFRAGAALHVVAGDGSGDRVLAPRAAPVAPAWRPDASHTLAFAAPGGAVVVARADAGARRRVARIPNVRALAWAGRSTLLAAAPHRVVALEVGAGAARPGNRRGSPPGAARGAGGAWSAPGARIAALAAGPAGHRRAVAVLVHRRGTSELRLLAPRVRTGRALGSRRLLAIRGRARGLVWSPDGRWLATALPSRGRWLLVPTAPGLRPRAVTGLARAFEAPAATARPRAWAG